MSAFNIGAAARERQSTASPGAGASAAASGQASGTAPGGAGATHTSGAYGASVDYAAMDMFADAEYRTQLAEREARGQMSPREAVNALDDAIRGALGETHVASGQNTTANIRNGVGFVSTPQWGSMEWFQNVKDSHGIFFSLPPALDDWLDRHDARGGSDRGESNALWREFAGQLKRMNDYVSKMIQNGGSDEEVLATLNSIVAIKGISDAGDMDEGKVIEDMEKGFPQLMSMALRNTKYLIDKGMASIDGKMSAMIGRGLGQAGLDALIAKAEEMELEIFSDPEQYKVDVNLAIMEFQESIGGDMMSWTDAERRAFNDYVGIARQEAITGRETQRREGSA